MRFINNTKCSTI